MVTQSRPFAATWALFLGFALVMVGNGLQGVLVGLRTTLEGFGSGVGGVIMAAYFAGFLVGSRFAARAISGVGHIRVFAAMSSLASTAALVHALVVTPVSWILMRFVTGLCMAGLYVVVESWLNDLATVGTVMGRFGAGLFFVALVATHGAIACYLGYRILFRRPPPAELRDNWQPLSARSSVMVGDLLGPAADDAT